MKTSKKTLILLSMLLLLFVVNLGNLSAWNFDNVKSYDENTKTVTINDCSLWAVTCLVKGDKIADIKLLSPQKNTVGFGSDVLVAEFEINNYKKYSDVFSGMEFFDLNKNNISLERSFTYKYRKNQNQEWTILNTQEELPPGKITIGVFTKVYGGDNVEWIPTLYGNQRINEWASWNSTFNTSLVHYWSFKEGTGYNATDYMASNGNASFVGSPTWAVGKNGYGLQVSSGNYVRTGTLTGLPSGTSDFTTSMWFKPNSPSGTLTFFWDGVVSNNLTITWNTATNQFRLYRGGGVILATNAIADGTWYHIATSCVSASGTCQIYINGTSIVSTNGGANSGNNITMGMGLTSGSVIIDEGAIWSRRLDPNEIVSLYDSGAGTFYEPQSLPSVVTLNSPADYYNSSTSLVDINCSALSLTGNILNVSLYINGVRNYTKNGSSSYMELYDSFNFNEGSNQWTCNAVDDSNNIVWAIANRTLNVDTQYPTVNISYPTGDIMDDFVSGETKTIYINYTAKDDTLNTCWYYNSTDNVTVSCASNITFTLPYGSYTHYVYANDSFNRITQDSITVNYAYKLLGKSQTYNASTIENSIENFITNVSFNSSIYSIANAQLYYNGTTYTTTKTTSGSDTLFSRSITIPNNDYASNMSFKWLYSLTGVNGTTYFNSTPTNQFVNRTNASVLNSPYSTNFINFTVYDEKTLDIINASISVSMDYGLTSLIRNISFGNDSGALKTVSFGFDPKYKSFLVSGDLQVSKSGYSTKLITIPSQTLTNTTTKFSVYLLNSSDSVTFIIAVRDSAYAIVEGAVVYIDRYYPDTDTWLTTEIVTTNYEGNAIAHLEAEDVNYRFRVYVNGVLKLTTGTTRIALGSTPYTITLTLEGDTEFVDFTNITGFDYSLTYSESSYLFTYSYSDTDSTADGGRLIVLRASFGNATEETICDTSSASTDAVLTCDISSGQNGTYYAFAYNYRTTATTLVDTLIVKKINDIVDNIGIGGVIWAVFLIMGIVMLGLFKPVIAVVFTIASVIMVSLLGIVSIPALALSAIILIGIILIWGMKQ